MRREHHHGPLWRSWLLGLRPRGDQEVSTWVWEWGATATRPRRRPDPTACGRHARPTPFSPRSNVKVVQLLPPDARQIRVIGGKRDDSPLAWELGLMSPSACQRSHPAYCSTPLLAHTAHKHPAQNMLVGHTPEAALAAAAHSIKFFRQQQALADALREKSFANAERKHENRYNKVGAHGGFGAPNGAWAAGAACMRHAAHAWADAAACAMRHVHGLHAAACWGPAHGACLPLPPSRSSSKARSRSCRRSTAPTGRWGTCMQACIRAACSASHAHGCMREHAWAQRGRSHPMQPHGGAIGSLQHAHALLHTA